MAWSWPSSSSATATSRSERESEGRLTDERRLEQRSGRLPDPAPRDRRRADRVPRLGQHLAEAAPGDRGDGRRSSARRTRRSTAAPTGSPPRRPIATKGARAAVARLINAPHADEVVFTKNATEAINLVASSWGGANLRQGDVVLLTHMEHHANIVPWHMLAQTKGIELRWVPLTADGQLDLTDLDRLLDGAKVFSFTAMSNVLGTITPVAKLCAAAHDAGRDRDRRRLPVRAPQRDRRAGVGRRLRRLLEPQDVRTFGHRCAVGPDRAARRDAAVHRRRQHDRRRPPRRIHVRTGARQVRGRHAADHRGDRFRRRRRVPRIDRHGRGAAPRDGAHALRDRHAHRALRRRHHDPRPRQRRGSRRCAQLRLPRHPSPRRQPGARRAQRVRAGRTPLRQAADARSSASTPPPGRASTSTTTAPTSTRWPMRSTAPPISSASDEPTGPGRRRTCRASKTSIARSSSTTTARRATAASCRSPRRATPRATTRCAATRSRCSSTSTDENGVDVVSDVKVTGQGLLDLAVVGIDDEPGDQGQDRLPRYGRWCASSRA